MFAALGLVFLAGAAKKSEREVRVLIGDLNKPTMIEGKNLKLRSKWKTLEFSDKIQLEPREGKIFAQDKDLGSSVRIESRGPISVSGHPYHGGLAIEKVEGHFLLINSLDLDDYLAGVVKNEMPVNWPLDALKAQTVLARTYALGKLEEPRTEQYDLLATVEDQVYTGMDAEDEASWKAIKETEGEVLYYRGEPASVYYHSCCGGWTESVEYVWGKTPKSYLQAQKCDACQDCPYYFWRYPEKGALSPGDLANRLGYSGEAVGEVTVTELSPGQRVMKLQLKFQSGYKTELSGNDFRVRLGREAIRSALFKVEKTPEGFIVFGSGSGHGVGLCQWGAKGMAEAGKSYQEILEHYFPGTEIKKIY